MDLSPTDEQLQLEDALTRLLAQTSSPDAVRAAEPSGFDANVHAALIDMGVFAMGMAPDDGGAGASLADLAVAARLAGAALAPSPVVETIVAGLVLSDDRAKTDASTALIEAHVQGTALVVFAPRPASNHIVTSVPGAAVADHVIVLDGDQLVAVATPEPQAVHNMANAPVGDVTVPDDPTRVVVLAQGALAHDLFTHAQDKWRALQASRIVGMGKAALQLGVTYAKERKQFDVAIGSFQAVAHQLADAATDLDGAALLAAKAIWALDAGETEAGRFASSAYLFAGDTAQKATAVALHVHGGYGFMEEYDVQLYFRHASAARLTLGDPRRELLALTDRIVPEDGRLDNPATYTSKPIFSPSRDDANAPRLGPDFRLGADVEAFRDEIHAFLADAVTDDVIERAHTTGTIHDWGLHRGMADQGWISAGWPAEFGGGGRSPLEMNVLSEEMYLSGAPVDGIGVASLVAHTLLLEGSQWLKETIIPEIISGEVITALGYSEPESGSDVAACATKAIRDGDEWTIDGQKMFTTLAHEAGYVFLLARTNTEVAKHKGLTMFIVPMSTPGIEISPVHTMGGERTNITYYDGVKINDRYRVGEVDGGWKVMMTALVFERNAAWYGEAVRLLDHGIRWAATAVTADGEPKLVDPFIRERIARVAIGNEVANLLGWRAAWLASIGTLPSVEGTMAKLFTTEHYQRSAKEMLDMLGADGVRRIGSPNSPADGWIEAIYRHCQVTTIYGGTSEVLRNIIAQRGLGLPKG